MTPKKWTIFVLLLAAATLTIGCTAVHTIAPDFEQIKPRSIAVLPVLNDTLDMDAPKVVQPIISRYMTSKGYELTGIRQTKLLLAKENIREAGQVFSLTYPELGKLLGADALLFCTVTDWSTLYLVVYASVTVECRFELIEAHTGKRLWEATYKSTHRASTLLGSSVEDTLDFAIHTPYEPRAQVAVAKCLDTLPNGPYFVGRKRRGCIGP